MNDKKTSKRDERLSSSTASSTRFSGGVNDRLDGDSEIRFNYLVINKYQ